MFKNILKQKINIIDNSMEPSLKHGDFIVMRKIIFSYDPKRFDLIFFKNNGMNLIKR
ncbi:MAG: S26 family signal peptidase, partial [Chloroflexi bacterium]|nr:S26 family signal peptidase [Chloroflexota bacterium]